MDYAQSKLDEQTKYGTAYRRYGIESANGYIEHDSVLPVSSRLAGGATSAQTELQKPVYDILNAGPRSRFVVRGVSGPFVVHNCCQSLARIIIGEQLINIAKKYRVVLTVHDAIACIAPKDEVDEAIKYVEMCMHWTPEWAQGLPLGCEAGHGESYGDC